MYIALRNIHTNEEFSYEDFDIVIYPSDLDQQGPELDALYLPTLIDNQCYKYVEENWEEADDMVYKPTQHPDWEQWVDDFEEEPEE
jgi:hypothetical protein